MPENQERICPRSGESCQHQTICDLGNNSIRGAVVELRRSAERGLSAALAKKAVGRAVQTVECQLGGSDLGLKIGNEDTDWAVSICAGPIATAMARANRALTPETAALGIDLLLKKALSDQQK